jgi:glycosyltransferase involved in cell wall biosynthesis
VQDKSTVTVVIPTLGGETLAETIDCLNSGSVIPYEILICIPEDYFSRVESLSSENIKIIRTQCKGQVAQRSEGFKKAKCEYVLQLDDDMIVEKNCIKYLLAAIKLHGPSVAVAPSLVNIITGDSVYKKIDKSPMLESIIYWLMNGSSGYQPGKIDRSGTPIGVDAKNSDTELLDIEWLAGGCIIHRKENLLVSNFYPFKGKAFGEDVIHSILIKDKGIKLLIETKASCSLEIIPSSNYSLKEFLANIRADYKVRRYYLALISRKSIRIYLYYLLCIVGYIAKKNPANYNE